MITPPDTLAIPVETEDELQHLNVLLEAQRLFIDRSVLRGDLWRQFPPSDKVRELHERVSRMEMIQNGMYLADRMESGVRELRAEAIDVISFATFLVKQLDEGARG